MLNQPAGHLEPDESLVDAALRETLEETGWDVRLTAFVGAYQWKAPLNGDGSGGRHYLRFAFAAEPLRHDPARAAGRRHRARPVADPRPNCRPPRRAIAARWCGRSAADFLAGRRHPLDLLQHLHERRRHAHHRGHVRRRGLLGRGAAAARAGEPIAGLFMQNWADDGSGDCRAEDDRRDAVAVCGRLGIPIHFRDFSSEYWAGVFEHFLAEYAAGRTPNPGRAVQPRDQVQAFPRRRARARRGAHRDRPLRPRRADRRPAGDCCARADRSKDQSYFLHQLGQAQLAATLFPLGELLKTDVRADRARGRPADRTPRRTPPASASSANAISASSSAATCPRARARCARPTAT